MTSAIRRFVSSLLSACAGALSGGLEAGLDVFAFSASRSTEKSWPHFRPSAPPTGEGRKRAKERGIRFGRPRKMMPHQRQEALQRLAAGETQADAARTYAVDAATISRLAAAALSSKAR